MSDKSFSWAFNYGFLIGGTISGFLYAAFVIYDKICDQDEQIEELSSRLEDLEEENHN